MAERPILMWPDDFLSEPSAPVVGRDEAVLGLIADLVDTMYSANGRGLAAPQVGVSQRIFVIDVTWKEGTPDPITFINPVITAHSEATHVVMEQCLSIPQLPMPVTRPSEIDVSWETVSGAQKAAHFSGDAARCIQHEFDHLEGRMIFDHQSAEDRAALEAAYAP